MRSIDVEELALYALIGAIGMIPVLLALWTGRVFSTDETIGLVMIVVGIAGGVAVLRTAWREKHGRS
jgi:hypothetical protein